MLNKVKNRKESGFTIIEVLVVLAIAGLIMIIVFLAVPNLQRSQRNTSRKNDAARVASGVSDYGSNNNGQLPRATAANWATDCNTVVNDAGGFTALGQLSDVTCGTGGTSTPTANRFNANVITAGGTVSAAMTHNSVQLLDSAVCGTNGSYTLGTTRQAALFYAVETGSGNWTWTCIQAE